MQHMSVRSYQSKVNNAQGRLLEEMIEGAAQYYKIRGYAQVIKTPEPFRVLRKDRSKCRATVQFTAHAQPDFIGCLNGGRMIVFEAKYTTTDHMKQDVVTSTQAEALDVYQKLGGHVGVCCGIQGEYFMVPWSVWKAMKENFGRKYATAQDLKPYSIPFDGNVYFLDRPPENF